MKAPLQSKNNQTERKRTPYLLSGVLALAFTGLGLSMPSCPGQEAMQKQIDGLTKQNGDIIKKLQTVDAPVKAAATELAQMKELLQQTTTALQAQAERIAKLEAAVTTLQTQAAASSRGGRRR